MMPPKDWKFVGSNWYYRRYRCCKCKVWFQLHKDYLNHKKNECSDSEIDKMAFIKEVK